MDNNGLGVAETILILIVITALMLAFRDEIGMLILTLVSRARI